MRFWKALYCFSPISKLPISGKYCLCLSKETAFCFALICLLVCLIRRNWVLPMGSPGEYSHPLPHSKKILQKWKWSVHTIKLCSPFGLRPKQQVLESENKYPVTLLYESMAIYISFVRYNRSIIKSSVRILKTKRVSVSREEWIWSLQVKMCTTLTISNRQTKPKRKENFFFDIKEVRQP